jgi:hypothetical protein
MSPKPERPKRTPANIELNIDELVLHGFAPGDRYRIAAAVERELARLFAEHGVPPSLLTGGDLASLDGDAFQVVPGAKPDAIGSQVAQSVYGGVSHER